MSVLLAAERQQPTEKNTITVSEDDVVNAVWYMQNWGQHSIELILNAGTGQREKNLERVLSLISDNPGVKRTDITRPLHIFKKEADEIFGTLEDRGLVRTQKEGKGTYFWPA
jgi:hypothetical protein